MRKLTTILICFCLVILFSSCPDGIKKKQYYDAYFPEIPVNLIDINSEFDDFNSALPETHFGKQLIFSSNRRSSGEDFDIIGENLHATWYWETGELTVDNSYYWQETSYINALLNKIEKNNNQFAPYTIGFDSEINDKINRINLLAYSTNSDTNFYKSEFMYHLSSDYGETGEVFGPYQIPFLSDYSQQYISFFGTEINSIDRWDLSQNEFTEMYFDKSNNATSDIYHINIPDSLDFLQFLISQGDFLQEKVQILNSNSNDKCPFINGNFMVFTSDRPGGFGGYDLYFSYYYNGSWTEPVNFGERVNTEFDEFRPISMQADGFLNDMMVFSSNRPGGLGAYDLYYVGIDKINPLIYTTK